MAERVHVATALTPHMTAPRLSRTVTVGQLAAYLAHVEPDFAGPTLEVATPVRFDERLAEADLAGGDRLLLFSREASPVAFATPLAPGDVMLELVEGDYRVTSNGRRGLLVGTPEGGRAVPDIDLRRVCARDAHPYLSRSTLWLSYENRTWYAARTGQTRVRLDDFEVGGAKIPLNDGQRLTFYRASDHPDRSVPMGGLTLRLNPVTEASTAPPLPSGNELVSVGTARESYRQQLRASGAVPLDLLVSRLAAYNDVTLAPGAALYRLRLAPMHRRITALELNEGQFLYAALEAPASGLALQLRAVDSVDIRYSLLPAEGGVLIGCRLQPAEQVVALDVDLYELFAAREAAPHQVGLRTPFLARMDYAVAENAWRVRPSGNALPIFVNTTRVSDSGLPLMPGDVLTLGESLERYYARLEVVASREV